MKTLLNEPPHLPLIAPSILSADFAEMGQACQRVLDAGADMLHLDVMDGHFVPNLTMGPDMCKALRRRFPDTFLDVHLMVTDPLVYAEAFVSAGADNLTFHVELGDADHIRSIAERIRSLSVNVGLAINPPTPVDRILPLVSEFDLLLVMSVNPGFSGQSFIEDTLDKTKAIHRQLRSDQRLQMDGGLSPDNASRVRDAGCDVLVAASAIFKQPADAYSPVINALRG